jgi:UDPglucose 6-dehydrogenase
MNIAVIGTGYVGLVSGACFADFGHAVVCLDTNVERIESLTRLEIPFYEPGLAELVGRNASAGRLRFTTDVADAVASATVIFLAVGTPEGQGGAADLSQVEGAVRSIASQLDTRYRLLVTKSTVPVGTGEWIRELLARVAPPGADVEMASNPEFLREGSAINDFMRPDRVVIGAGSDRAAELLREIYRPLFLIETPILVTDLSTAEMIKCASNAFLAVKISFMNEIAHLCDRVGADVHGVAKGMGLDKRIGSKFLHPGPGYGGSCFPKDTRALAVLGESFGVPQRIVETAASVNDRQQQVVMEKLSAALGGLSGRTVAVMGLAFKPNTSDVREAPALHLCRNLVAAGATVKACDPVAAVEAAHALHSERHAVEIVEGPYEAAVGADAAVIMTEWNEFRNLDLARLAGVMRRPVLFDTRNVLDPEQPRQLGFEYLCTGRQAVGAAGRVAV